MTTTSQRVLFVDLARAAAVLFMIQGHALHVLLDPQYQGGTVFNLWLYVRGLTSCTFLTLAGFSFSLATTRHWAEYRTLSSRTRRRLSRFGAFLLFGYAMRIPIRPLSEIWRVTPAQWQAFAAVDILHLIAVTLTVLQGLVWLARTPRRLGAGALAATGVVVLLTPAVWHGGSTSGVPVFLAAYLSAATGSLFPIFPWAAYVFLGAALGVWFQTTGTTNPRAMLLLAGLSAFVTGLVLHQVPLALYGSSDFWTTSPNLFLVKAGSVLVLLAAAAHATRSRAALPFLVTVLSRESLTVYLVHVCILYGSIWNDGLVRIVGPRFDPVGVAGCIVLLAGSMSLLAWLWHECKRRGPYWSAAIRAATTVLLAYAIS